MKMRTKLKELRDLKPLNNRSKINLKGGRSSSAGSNFTGESGAQPPPPPSDR